MDPERGYSFNKHSFSNYHRKQVNTNGLGTPRIQFSELFNAILPWPNLTGLTMPLSPFFHSQTPPVGWGWGFTTNILWKGFQRTFGTNIYRWMFETDFWRNDNSSTVSKSTHCCRYQKCQNTETTSNHLKAS